MAGNYPDVPDLRMMLDVDGTSTLKIDNVGTITPLTVPQQQAIQDENDLAYTVIGQGTTGYLVFVFPELRDLSAYFICHAGSSVSGRPSGTNQIDTSTDTTTGNDGTWTNRVASLTVVKQSPIPASRTSIQALAVSGIKAIRFKFQTATAEAADIAACHLYGKIASGQNPDRLRLWHPTLDQELGGAALDLAEISRATTYTKTFRVKNNSSTLTANSVTLSTNTLYESAAPTTVSQLGLSLDGTTFASSRNISSIAPGAISGVVTLRWAVDSAAIPGLWSPRVQALAASWS